MSRRRGGGAVWSLSWAGLLLAAWGGAAKFVEVPAVVKEPLEVVPEFVDLPKEHPVWEGPQDTLGVLLGETELWEGGVRHGGFQLVVGVAGNAFNDPADMKEDGTDALRAPDGRLFFEVRSSLSATIYKRSLAAHLHPTQPRPFYVSGSTQGCPGDVMCRISINFPAMKHYELPGTDEYVDVVFGPALLANRTARTKGFRLKILDDEQKEATVLALADALEIVAGSSLLFGSSNPAVMSTSRQLLLLHMKCGVEHDALDHATNPAEYAVGDGRNRYYIGGLVTNLLLGLGPILLHLSLVLFQWKCCAMPKNTAPLPHQEILAADEPPEARCFGVTITEFRQLQAAVRYPHYSSLLLLFAFQGVATCAWRLLLRAETPGERALGVCALLFFVAGGMFFAWWKLGRGQKRRMGAVYACPEKDRDRKWLVYFLGPGEWVSSSKRRLVHCYAILFECYREGCTRFILVELALHVFLALMGTLDAGSWTACIVEFAAVGFGLAIFLALVLWTKPWASGFDNHVLAAVTALQLLSVGFFLVAFFMKDVSSPVHRIAEYVVIFTIGVLILKCFADVLLLVWDTCSGRRWRLQEMFEQGQTLFQGRHCYRKAVDDFDDPDDVAGEAMLREMAPRAAAVYVKHVLPEADEGDDEAQHDDLPRDPFDHAAGCLVDEGVVLLSRRGAKQPFCPCCHAGCIKPPGPADEAAGGLASRARRRLKKEKGRSKAGSSVDERELSLRGARDSFVQQQPLVREASMRDSGGGGGGGGGDDPLARSRGAASGAGSVRDDGARPPPRRRHRGAAHSSSPVSVHGAWKEYLSPDGVAYFHNTATGETSWAPPFDEASTDRYDV